MEKNWNEYESDMGCNDQDIGDVSENAFKQYISWKILYSSIVYIISK